MALFRVSEAVWLRFDSCIFVNNNCFVVHKSTRISQFFYSLCYHWKWRCNVVVSKCTPVRESQWPFLNCSLYRPVNYLRWTYQEFQQPMFQGLSSLHSCTQRPNRWNVSYFCQLWALHSCQKRRLPGFMIAGSRAINIAWMIKLGFHSRLRWTFRSQHVELL